MTGTVSFVSGHEVSKKTQLFLKVREIKEIRRILSNVEAMSQLDQDQWVEEYGEMINDAIDSFIDDSQFSLEHAFADDEILALSQELLLTLKETIETVEGIMYAQSQLES
ncbi:MAG: hypothetical protein H6773_02425 [Pseudomonadales bacterium]|nr:hypothetical protein [Candidatus Woesebacteria bacterium]MCB9801011.1 hypothetical protein [Pseudomonadales bacterium]